MVMLEEGVIYALYRLAHGSRAELEQVEDDRCLRRLRCRERPLDPWDLGRQDPAERLFIATTQTIPIAALAMVILLTAMDGQWPGISN
jgi:hypothetical protein